MTNKTFKSMPGRGIPLKGRVLTAALAAAASAMLLSCSPRATITVPADSTAPTGALFGTAFTPASEALIRKLTGLGTAGAGAAGGASAASVSIFDAPGITASLKATGLSVQSVTVDGASLAVSALVAKPETLLAGSVAVNPGDKTFKATVDRKAVNAAIGLMPASTRDYLDLLMAPVFTGEAMTTSEYRELIGAAYGKTIAGELDAARFTLTVKTPGPVKNAKIDASAPGSNGASGTVKTAGSEAVFTIPLITLLVLESPLTAEVGW